MKITVMASLLAERDMEINHGYPVSIEQRCTNERVKY